MEIKRNGKVEHSDSTHDDQVFSMLMALWVWYEGTNLGERYGIRKTSIKTDDEVDEPLDYFNDDTVEIVDSFSTKDELDEQIEQDLNAAIAAGGTPIQQFLDNQRMEEKKQFEQLAGTPLGEKAYRNMYNIPKDQPINKYINTGDTYELSEDIFTRFYDPMDKAYDAGMDMSDRPRPMAVPADQAYSLEDDGYRYQDHFNF